MRVNWGGDQGAMCGRQCDIHRDVPDRTQAVVMIIIAVAEQTRVRSRQKAYKLWVFTSPADVGCHTAPELVQPKDALWHWGVRPHAERY